MSKGTTDLIKYLQAWDPEKFRKDATAFSEREFVTPETDMGRSTFPTHLLYQGLQLPS